MSLIGYARVSTAESRQVLDRQFDALYTAGRERVFEDHVSGAAVDRTALAAYLDYLRRGDVLVVLDPDRLGRLAGELITLIDEFSERGIGFRALNSPMDATTPAGRAFLHIHAAFACPGIHPSDRVVLTRAKGSSPMKLRQGDPWMSADEYGRSLRGLTVNLLVRDVERSLAFAREVLGVEVVYRDPDFAVLRHGPSEWMLHADHTYRDHPLHGSLAAGDARGIGAEIRIHDTDPDAAEAAARRRGDPVLAGSMDKPHGVREVFILDPDGYLWAVDRPLDPSS